MLTICKPLVSTVAADSEAPASGTFTSCFPPCRSRKRYSTSADGDEHMALIAAESEYTRRTSWPSGVTDHTV